MPQRNQPITRRPKVEDESIGEPPSEKHGKHRERDEALPGKGSEKGGLNRDSGGNQEAPGGGGKQSTD